MLVRTALGLLSAGIASLTFTAPVARVEPERTPWDTPWLGGDGATQDSRDTATASDGEEKEEGEKLTLERLFPEKSYFGPSARSTSFSHDGRYGAFLYRSWLERRHGYDLYVYDTTNGQIRRMTSVGRLAPYQAEAREVRDDREKKARQAGVTIEGLAREQADAMGWNAGLPTGTWTGESTVAEAGSIPAGTCDLSLAIGDDGKFTGELRVGLVRLPVRDGAFDAAERKLIAKVMDEKLDVKDGVLTLRLEDNALKGDLAVADPSIRLSLALKRKPDGGDRDRKDKTPKGVLGAIGERLTLGDVVLPDDAEINDEKDGKRPDKRAPRYDGVQGYEWSPVANEVLLISGGDVYRLVIDQAKWDEPITRPGPESPRIEPNAKDQPAEPAGEQEQADEGASDDAADAGQSQSGAAEESKPAEVGKDSSDTKNDERPRVKPVAPYLGDLTRLTRTRERESDVQYLPDGSGYTYLRAGALLQVCFGDHRIVQLDPQLKDGERMVGYKISPDRKRLVFLANRGDNYWASGRQVTIVNYRDRFARAEQVIRHMSDDPWPEAYSSVYLFDLNGHEKEEGTLERVFTKRITGPRDVLRVPEWSLDSSRVAFAAFEQSTNMIKVLEAGFIDEKKKDEKSAKVESPPNVGATTQDEQVDKQDEGEKKDGDQPGDAGKKAEDEKPEFKIENARVVYEFYHFGGPNTPGMVQPQYLPDSRRMVFITELSGYRQLSLLDPRYQQLTQLTHGQFEVYPFDISEDHTTIFATATLGDAAQEQVFAIDTGTGAMRKLSTREGVYSSVAVSDDGRNVLANHADFGALTELQAITTGEEATTVVFTDSHPEEAHRLTSVSPEYFTFDNRHGQSILGHMFKPKDWTPEDKRPLLIYVYGGPLGEQKMATRGSFNTSSYGFARYMTEVHGWVTATIDPRGASGYGAIFEKANFEQVGKPQTEDLVDGANWLVKHAGVDKTKMALHGWSFGGFQTQMVMYTEPDVFAAGIAGAGPTEWENYNSWYSTGTIGAGQVGKPVLEKYSLLPLAKNLKGRLLLIHGMEDSNVLYQDTVRVYRELLKAGKEVNVELFLDPTGGHGLGGDVKTLGRFRKYEDFLLRYLGEGRPAEQVTEEAAQKAESQKVSGDGTGDEKTEGQEPDAP
ncbi:MAG: prolyl oligopeptidase family serine peptidase [Phycisphaerales bacterium]|nr:prolyl oligopeptidase family serine peptidase [Phycisphaerales bacterium]